MAINPHSIEEFAQKQQITGPLGQSVLLLVAIILVGWFLLKPAYTDYQTKRAELKAARQQLANIEKDKAELDRLASQLRNSEAEVKITDEALPLISRVTRLDVLLDTLAKSSGLQVGDIDAQGIDGIISAGNKEVLKDPFGANRSLQTTEVTMFLTGTVDQLRNFLQLLETSGRLVDVSDMDVATGDGVTRFRLTLKAYSYDVAGTK